MTNCLCKPLIQGLVELRLFSLVFISLLIQLEIGSYVERVTGFKKALLGPRLDDCLSHLDAMLAGCEEMDLVHS